jgi:hypothetical protein
MPQKPRLESVVVLVVSLTAIGMTVASLFALVRESAEVTTAPTAQAGAPAAPVAVQGSVPAARAAAPAMPAAKPRPDAGGMQCKLERKTAPAGVPAAADRDGRPRCKSLNPPGRPT